MSGYVTVRPARASELNVVSSLWDSAASWLASRGIDQWQYPARHEAIARNIAAGDECWMVEQDGVIIGTITIDCEDDPEFWTAADAPETALYIHRMVVLRQAAGNEVGTALLDWASQRAKAGCKEWLRLDAWRTNPGLLRYYEERGFDLVRIVELPHRRSGALYQRKAGVVLGRGPEIRELSR